MIFLQMGWFVNLCIEDESAYRFKDLKRGTMNDWLH
ncbi:hypothetical protein E1A91_D10G066500v1 [Gossypium mustelinum]|uniref:Uncharacterized protein n=1 Tax=Gossypium mustelinum TaxID=34275 RepID=A0A5D2T439_GOSMU|nr:hypothetical protein E1A91_D10G066500v1 [Gossypium mustelinum]